MFSPQLSFGSVVLWLRDFVRRACIKIFRMYRWIQWIQWPLNQNGYIFLRQCCLHLFRFFFLLLYYSEWTILLSFFSWFPIRNVMIIDCIQTYFLKFSIYRNVVWLLHKICNLWLDEVQKQIKIISKIQLKRNISLAGSFFHVNLKYFLLYVRIFE